MEMLPRHQVVRKVVDLMDQSGMLLRRSIIEPSDVADPDTAIMVNAIVVDHLMWVLGLGDPKIPGAALVRQEYEVYLKEGRYAP